MIRAIAIRNGKKSEVQIHPLHDEMVLSEGDIEFIRSALEDIDSEKTERFEREAG